MSVIGSGNVLSTQIFNKSGPTSYSMKIDNTKTTMKEPNGTRTIESNTKIDIPNYAAMPLLTILGVVITAWFFR